MSVVRVYHPTADTFADVQAVDVPAWEKQGWTRRPGNHIDDSGALPVGAGHTHPRAPKQTRAATKPATKPSARPKRQQAAAETPTSN